MAESPRTRAEPDQDFEALLDFLRRQRGFDFTGYKRIGLMRRVRKRMGQVGVDSFSAYLDFLEVHQEEFTHLFDVLLINVTGFFRDPESWQTLREEVIPRILESRRGSEPIRIWSAGCSSGQEAYTLVMAFVEAMGVDAFKAQVKVYATDVDEEALAQARAASYWERDVEGVPEELREKYFEPVGGRFVFRADLRRFVIFGRNDLAQDAPISHLDLLVCRNALMYFTAEAQTRILARFHFALEDHGFLFLGRAEMLLTRSNIFRPSDIKARIFTKVPKHSLRDRLLVLAQGDGGRREEGPDAPALELRDVALDCTPVAQIIVDREGRVAFINEKARSLFRLSLHEVGRQLKDLEVSYRPVELRSRISQVLSEQRVVYLHGVEHHVPGGSVHYMDLQVAPLVRDGGLVLGVSVTFTDVTPFRRVQAELQHANEQLETAYEELQATNEEMETTNEELQSTVEELETTNEELQSTNEELETMNEELHSTNEELETINDELRRRTEELNQVSGYMESILSSLQAAVVVLDRDLAVQLWNDKAEDLWGLREEEVGETPFLELDIGLPVRTLEPLLREGAVGEVERGELVVPARNRRGRDFECRVTVTPLQTSARQAWGVIVMMEEWTLPGTQA